MGLDVSLFGYSTQDYVLQSISTLYLPLLAIAALALGWLALHRQVDPCAGSGLRAASPADRGAVALGVGLLMAALVVLTASVNRQWVPLVNPLVLGAAWPLPPTAGGL